MPAPLETRVEDLVNEYERQRAALGDVQRRLREVAATATSPRREVTVTVGAQGALQALSFPTAAYKRMAPQELAAVVMTTLTAAQQQATELTAGIVAGIMPDGLDAHAVLTGGQSEVALPPEARMHPMIREQLDRQGVQRS